MKHLNCLFILIVFTISSAWLCYHEGYYEGVGARYVKISIGVYPITSYKAVKEECDDTPDEGAFGRVARKGVPTDKWFANVRLPKGTKIMIPSISGDTIWTLKDRMPRYVIRNGKKVYLEDRIDLLIHKNSVHMGKRNAEVFIVKEL